MIEAFSSEHPTCRKCGYDVEVAGLWHPNTNLPCELTEIRLGEHLHRSCGQCGFQWLERPKDWIQRDTDVEYDARAEQQAIPTVEEPSG